jgi:MSHA biogenesis protein MshK
MAEFVKGGLRFAVMCGALWCVLPLSFAQALVDPTRPPGAASGEAQDDANKGPVLQSILIGKGRREAIISGRTVTVGERFGEARVVSITDTEVVLQNGSEWQRLKLFPSIEKRVGTSRESAKLDLREQEK